MTLCVELPHPLGEFRLSSAVQKTLQQGVFCVQSREACCSVFVCLFESTCHDVQGLVMIRVM